MPSFPKPSYYHDFIVNNEIHTLRNYLDTEEKFLLKQEIDFLFQHGILPI